MSSRQNQDYLDNEITHSLLMKSKKNSDKKSKSTKQIYQNKLANNKSFNHHDRKNLISQQFRQEKQESSSALKSPRSEMIDCTHTPKINKRSEELAQESFKKMSEHRDQFGNISSFFLFKSQSTQTTITYKDLHQKNSFQIYKKVRLPTRQKSTTFDFEQSEEPIKKVNTSTQTEDIEQNTPGKQLLLQQSLSEQSIKHSRNNTSSSQISYYVPIHQRCDYIIKANNNKSSLSLINERKNDLSAIKKKPKAHDDGNKGIRLKKFLEKQNTWQKEKHNRIISQQMNQTQFQETKKLDQAAEDEKQLKDRVLLSHRSRFLADRSIEGMNFMSRLSYYEDKKKQRMFVLSDDQRGCTFTPHLSPNSRQIVSHQMMREQGFYQQYL